MIKKITTKTHTFLVEEEFKDVHKEAIYGKSLLLSIYIGFNKEDNTKSGNYYFSGNNNRIALRSNIISEEEPTEKEIEFYELLKKKKNLSYSKKIAKNYDIHEYIRWYFTEDRKVKTKEQLNIEEKDKLLHPRCKVFYDYSLLEKLF
ncbi:hypothetical protein MUA90_10955 [Staphylococcus sp. IVB6181]|uniref:hypothetical protein n=1 Tax=Staphylococcus sp. IVB6181 TaxID=2929481 RepID=UPI0021CF6A4F|nr:hypothetical protein [Staphylococcus sp. IVB6181]UXV34532.1 hypothetical protein MUA90_10955 [Staphylococcus sp. IVB6181]